MGQDKPKTKAQLIEELNRLRQRVTDIEAPSDTSHQVAAMAVINRLAIELAAAPGDADLQTIIAESLISITGALGVGVTRYEPQAQELILEHLAIPNEALTHIDALLGHPIVGTRIPLTEAILAQTKTQVILELEDLSSLPGKPFPRSAARAISRAFGIEQFVTMAIRHGDELMGTAVLAMPTGHPPLDPGVMEALSHVAAVSLQRRRVEEALRISRERYSTIANQVSDIAYAYRFQPDGTLAYEWGAGAFERVTGYDEQELATQFNRDWTQFIHPDDRSIAEELFRSHLTGEPSVGELRLVAKGGEIRWVRIYGHPMWDEAQDRLVRVEGAVQDVTARRMAEEALRRSEARFRQLAETVQDVFWLGTPDAGPQRKILYVNPAFETVFGITAEEVYASDQAWLEIVHPEDRDRVLETLETFLRDLETYAVEYRIVGPDGAIRWIWARGFPIRRDDGTVSRIAGLAQDITERKRAEQALRESRERYRTILDTIEDGYYEVDLAGNLTFFNDALCRIFGYPAEELLGMNNRQYMDETKARETYRVFNQVYRTGEPVRAFNWEITRQDGERRYLESSISLMRDERSEAVGFRGIARDVTEQKQAEAAVRREKDFTDRLVETAPAIVLVLDPEANIVRFNSYLEELSGYALEEVRGENWLVTFVPQADQARIRQVFQETLHDQPTSGTVQSIVTRDGTERIIEWHNRTIKDRQGQVTGVLSIGQDITERKRAQEALRQSEAFLSNVFDAIQDGISVLDSALNIVRVNAWMEALYAEEMPLVGRKCYAAFQGRSSPCPWCPATLTLETGETHGEIVPYPSAETPARWLEISAFPLKDQQGCVTRVIEYVRDVSHRVAVEQALSQRAAQLALLNDMGGKIAATLDLDSVLERAVSLVQERFGYHHVSIFTLDTEREELVMRAKAGDFARSFPEDHGLKLNQGVVGWVGYHGETLLVNDVASEPRYVNLYPDVLSTQAELSVPISVGGEVMGVLDVQSPHRNAFDGSDVMVMETLADQVAVAIDNARLYEAIEQKLVEREHTEQVLHRYSERLEEMVDQRTAALRESEEQARAQYKGIPVPTYTWRRKDGDFVLVDYNDAAEELTGGVVTNYVGVRATELHADRPDILQDLQRCYTEKTTIERELTYRYPDPPRELRLATKYAFIPPDLILVHTEDITDRKEMQERLVRSEKLATLGQVAGSIGHELRNPLGAIKNTAYFLNLVLEDPDEEVQDALQILEKEVNTSERIISSLLSFARTRPPSRRRVDINDLMEASLSRIPIQEEIEIRQELDPSLPIILADPEQVRQVLGNVILNALQAMPQGGTLRVATGEITREDGTHHVQISIADTGVGIPEDIQDKIFEPLFTTKAKGIGLGLALVKALVTGHGGTIEVASEEGKGSIFKICLPADGFGNQDRI